jgi:hypothetical protein
MINHLKPKRKIVGKDKKKILERSERRFIYGREWGE